MSCLNIEQTQPTINHELDRIVKELKQQLQGTDYNNSKPFFVSNTHHYLEKLIHLHSPQINQIIMAQSKTLQEKLIKSKQNDQQTSTKHLPHVNKSHLFETQHLLVNLIRRECKNRPMLQIKNILLQIRCMLTYSCPTCLKNKQKPSQSIKLIKHTSEEPYTQQPQTMKSISLQEPSPSKLQSIFQSMKAERNSIRQKQEAKQRRINKVWNQIGNILQLDREQFTIDYVINQEDKQNHLLKQLRIKNYKNSQQIIKFIGRNKQYLKKTKQQKILLSSIQSVSNKTEREKQKNKSTSLKNTSNSVKPAPLIYPKRNSPNAKQNSTSNQFSSTKPQQGKVGTKICFLNLDNGGPFAKNTISVCKNIKYKHFYRSFKSGKDVEVLKELQPCWNTSLKLI